MFTLLSALKLMTEIALLALCGQWVLGWLAGTRREGNLFYQLLQIIGRPSIRFTRWLSPRWVLDRHIPLAAFLLLILAWLVVTWAKISHCLNTGLELCR